MLCSALVLARLVALGVLAPRADRIALGAGPALAAAVRVIDRVHRHAAHRRTDAAPALRAGLADRAQVVLFVADLADGGAAIDVHLADLARAQPQLRVVAFARQQLHRGARRARDLRTLAGLHLHAMNRGADRDVAQRQRVADLDRSIQAAHQLRAGGQPLGRDDVAALAIGVAQQREVSAAVGVVLQALHLGRDAVLVAPEIHDPVVLAMPATLVTRGDLAEIVPPRPLRLLLGELGDGPALVQLGRDHLDHGTPAG